MSSLASTPEVAFDADGVGPIVGAESLLVSAPLEAGEAHAAAGDAVPALVSGIVTGLAVLPKVDNRVLGCVLGQNRLPRNLAGKPSAGFCATPNRRILVLDGPVVHVRRCNTHRFIDNRRSENDCLRSIRVSGQISRGR